MNLVARAKHVAYEAHIDQKYGKDPYTRHLDEVVSILKNEFHVTNERILAIGWLHDIVEDTKVNEYDLALSFGVEVSSRVSEISDRTTDGSTRAEKKERAHRRLKFASYDSKIVKAADRLANVRMSQGSSMIKRYRKEHEEFRACLIEGFETDSLLLSIVAQIDKTLAT